MVSKIAIMSRYAQISFLFPFMFLFSMLMPSVFSQLSSNQTTTMITLSKLLQNYTTSSPWNPQTQPNPCSWKGVSCTPNNSFITQLSLSRFSLSSEFIPLLCQLHTLESLDLSINHLASIPHEFITNCGAISGLKLLNFSRNRLDGSLPIFQGFVGLEFLDLSWNFMSGSVGFQLDGLVMLKSLNLSYNNFNGSLPIHLGKSMVLEKLQLSNNFFGNEFPEELVNYGDLSLIDLSSNRISGSLPERIRNLTKLEVLILSSNNFSGEIPVSLSKIKTLSRFSANMNNFVGTIPSGISMSLRNLDVSYNRLSGFIPFDLLSASNLQTVDLSYNSLEGSIPENISSSVVRLRLGSNMLNGSIPRTISNLTYLELDNNSLSGSIPSELGFCRNLALLNLAKNKLGGNLPMELGNLTHLQVMRLQFNNLVGVIPIEITKLPRLSILNISWNSLTGSIPSSISNLRSITNLNLQGNNLNGSIPTSIGALDSLLELQLGDNQLSGNVPWMPEILQIALNLSNNLFEGPIPITLSRLVVLEILDLSNNNFSGKIPDFLLKLPTLTHLILSNNSLSGQTPKFPPWVIIETSGNTDLTNVTRTPNPKPGSKRKTSSIIVAISIALSVSVLVIGVTVIILLTVPRRLYRVNDERAGSSDEVPLPQIIQGNILTSNGIHRSKIDFTKAMEAIENPSNVTLKTRFSTYYEAVMPSDSSYFIKKLNLSDKIFQPGSHEKFGSELERLGKLSNSHVMVPLAYVLSVDSAFLFYEFAEKGILFDVLHGSLGSVLDWSSRYSIAVGVAQGLAFLHECSAGPVLLLDLSSRTVMLKSLKEPVVGDIELYKVIDPSKSIASLSMVAGSVGYIPPEYAYTMRVTVPGNVYSFGVILLELLTGKPAVSEGTELPKWVSSNFTEQRGKKHHILDFTISQTSPSVHSQMQAVLGVALQCVSVAPEARPKMKSVLRMLLNAR